MLTCLDCKSCKLDRRLGVLWCKKGKWKTDFNKEKKISLSKNEIVHSDYIRHRLIFETAGECEKVGDYESMEE